MLISYLHVITTRAVRSEEDYSAYIANNFENIATSTAPLYVDHERSRGQHAYYLAIYIQSENHQ